MKSSLVLAVANVLTSVKLKAKKVNKAMKIQDTVEAVCVAKRAEIARVESIVDENKKIIEEADKDISIYSRKYYTSKYKMIISQAKAMRLLKEKQAKELDALRGKQITKRDTLKVNFRKELNTLIKEKTVAGKEITQGNVIIAEGKKSLGL